MNRPEPNRHDQDAESMFDFLDEEAANVTRERPVPTGRIERQLPIIRKPVPVSESGPLRAPSPHDALDDDDFDFLGRGADDRAHGDVAGSVDEPDHALDDPLPLDRLRPLLLLAAFALLGAGGIVTAWPFLPFSAQSGPEGSIAGASAGDVDALPDVSIDDTSGDTVATAVPPDGATASSTAAVPAGLSSRSLGTRFRDEVARVEGLVADGRLDDASRALATLDRAVYGYGIAEFSELETRIVALRGGDVAPSDENERVAEAERAEAERVAEAGRQAERVRVEAERVAEAVQLEAERIAEADRQAELERLEAVRIAEAERQAERERLAAERIASERVAAEQAAREAEAASARAEAREAARLRVEATSVVQESGGVATTTAADRARAQQRAADARATTIEADRRATDRRIAEQRAETAAAEARRVAALKTPAVEPRPVVVTPVAVPTPERRATIDDDDLQIVYASLLELKDAFENRDIAAVISLSDPPGGRVQQLLQLFANSETVETRITNVSARPADDAVTGTLRIENIRRADGSRIRPPPELASVALTSTRSDDGWSPLSW